jgi:hypothetical protein
MIIKYLYFMKNNKFFNIIIINKKIKIYLKIVFILF